MSLGKRLRRAWDVFRGHARFEEETLAFARARGFEVESLENPNQFCLVRSEGDTRTFLTQTWIVNPMSGDKLALFRCGREPYASSGPGYLVVTLNDEWRSRELTDRVEATRRDGAGVTPCSVNDLPHADRLGPALTRALDALIEMLDIIPCAQVKIGEQDAISFECTGGRPPPSFWNLAIEVVDAVWPSERRTG